jgi:mono/diheme cytochrome c family protein
MLKRMVCVAALGSVALGSIAIAADTTSGAAPTFSKDVAPILNKNCVSCHRPDEIAPMSLLTYEQVRPWAKSIREKVSRGQMPPWHAEEARGVFLNDRRLSDTDKATLVAWADAGAPQGNAKDLPAAPKFTEGWEIGKPDLVLTMSKSYDVPASGTIAYQYFQIPTNFTEDKWVQAIEVKPGARSVVHHILVFCKPPQSSAAAHILTDSFMPVVPKMPVAKSAGNAPPPNQTFGGGQGNLIATTAPGTNAMIYQPGDAIRVPAGSTLLLQVHYTANGNGATDQSSVGMIFAKEPPQREIHNSAFVNILMKLPAGAPNQAIDSAIEFSEDSHITALFPHTHLRGKSWEYRLIYPDGRSEVVLSVPKYDFNWQTYYEYAKPLAVPKGSRLEATAHYDNSVNNPSNPDPKIDVRWGEQTWQEMQYTGITYYVDQPASTAPSTTTAQK